MTMCDIRFTSEARGRAMYPFIVCRPSTSEANSAYCSSLRGISLGLPLLSEIVLSQAAVRNSMAGLRTPNPWARAGYGLGEQLFVQRKAVVRCYLRERASMNLRVVPRPSSPSHYWSKHTTARTLRELFSLGGASTRAFGGMCIIPGTTPEHWMLISYFCGSDYTYGTALAIVCDDFEKPA